MDNLAFDLDTWLALKHLVGRYGGVELPEPSGFDHCDDCCTFDARYPLGRVDVCVECWCRRAHAAERAGVSPLPVREAA